MICFDTLNNKSESLDADDFCFKLFLGKNEGMIFKNNIQLDKDDEKNYFAYENFLAVSVESDSNDRYSKTPHSTYEYRIPTDLVGRSDNYGFFIQAYDASKNEFFNWPTQIISNSITIPSPNQWGNLISPDKSLPEFSQTILFGLFIFSIMFLILYHLMEILRVLQILHLVFETLVLYYH